MIGIIGATVDEAKAIKAGMSNIREEQIYDIQFFIGKYSGKDVVFVQSGIGKVNAAITTTLLIEKYNVEKVIFSGVAGSTSEKIGIGDIVIGIDVVHHDFDTTEFGYKKGQVPQMPVYSFNSDVELVEKIRNIKRDDLKLFFGRILTGDQFINKKEEKIKLGVDFEALCVDMESAAVAQTCYRLNKKFVIIRSISDSITDDSTMEYDKFVELAAKNATKILDEVLV